MAVLVCIFLVWNLRDLSNIQWKHLEVFNKPHFYSEIMTPVVTSYHCYLLTNQRLVLKMCSPVLIMKASMASLRSEEDRLVGGLI